MILVDNGKSGMIKVLELCFKRKINEYYCGVGGLDIWKYIYVYGG